MSKHRKPGDVIDAYSLPGQPGVYSFVAPAELGGYFVRLRDSGEQPAWLVRFFEMLLVGGALDAVERGHGELASTLLALCRAYDAKRPS